MNQKHDDLQACMLCEHRCGVNRLAGELGVCRMGGPVVASRTLHPAPPASYTVFLAGCNFKCVNCQNWSISQYPDNQCPVDGPVPARRLALEAVTMLSSPAARGIGADRLFFSGGEPTIHLPYVEEVVAAARQIKPGLRVNFDTNGFLTEASLQRVLSFATSITFDLKAYYDDTMLALTGAPVAPVLRNAETVGRVAPDKLWEYRIVVIPGINEDDIAPLSRFIASISPELPVSFLAFRPNFVLDDHPGASTALLRRCVKAAKRAGLQRVSTAGVTGIPGEMAAPLPEVALVYQHEGARLAGSWAARRGCVSRPRDCRACDTFQACALKRYLPQRST